jgi:hypothetical protein
MKLNVLVGLRVNFTVEGILPGHYTIIFDLTFLPI